jgi:hypothetical protein
MGDDAVCVVAVTHCWAQVVARMLSPSVGRVGHCLTLQGRMRHLSMAPGTFPRLLGCDVKAYSPILLLLLLRQEQQQWCTWVGVHALHYMAPLLPLLLVVVAVMAR